MTSYRIKTFLLIFNILIFSLSTHSFELSFNKISPTVLAYQEYCEVDFDNQSLPRGFEKNFCEVVTKSPICKDVKEEYRRDCNVTIEVVNPLDGLGSCFSGFFGSLEELWDFLTEMLSLFYDEDKRAELSEEGSAFIDGLALYYETEVIKAKDDMSGILKDERASAVAAKNLFLKLGKDFLAEPLKEKYHEYACYNKLGAVHNTCKTLTDTFFPPLAFIAAIKKGPKLVKALLKDDDPDGSTVIKPAQALTIPKSPTKRSQLRWSFIDQAGREVNPVFYKHQYKSPYLESKPPRIGMAEEYPSESYTLLTEMKPLSGKDELVDTHLKNVEIKPEQLKKFAGGITDTYMVKLADGTQGIFKPRKPTDWASNYRAEVLAYEVDKLLDLDIVPPTVEKTVGDMKGSFQKFENSIGDGNSHMSFAKPEELDKQDFFDVIIDNRDRHKGNFLVTKNGNVHSIDHGLSFTGRGYNPKSFYIVEERVKRFMASDEGKKAVSKLKSLDQESFERQLSDYIGPLDANRTLERINFLIKLSGEKVQ